MESTPPALALIRERVRWNQDVVDVLVALGLFVAVTTVISTTVWVGPLTPLSLLLIGGQTLPLAVRRRYPVPVLIATAGATGLISALGFGESGGNLGVLIALYTVAANTDRRTAAWAGLFTGLGIALAFVGYAEQDPAAIQAAPSVALIYAITWIVGDSVRQRHEETARYKAASAQHERDRDERARLAVAEERARIARELHDVVAHYVSVMVVQAGAARRTAETDPQASQEALGAVEDSGRTALAEMRRMLEVLREEEGSLSPQPTLGDLDLRDIDGATIPGPGDAADAEFEYAIDANGDPVPGLYAIGELTGSVGINGSHGMDGMFLGPAVVTGRVAGKTITELYGDRMKAQVMSAWSMDDPLPDAETWEPSLTATELETLLATPRDGYWHFEMSHDLVLERSYQCTDCHSAEVPFMAISNRESKQAQLELCSTCHGH